MSPDRKSATSASAAERASVRRSAPRGSRRGTARAADPAGNRNPADGRARSKRGHVRASQVYWRTPRLRRRRWRGEENSYASGWLSRAMPALAIGRTSLPLRRIMAGNTALPQGAPMAPRLPVHRGMAAKIPWLGTRRLGLLSHGGSHSPAATSHSIVALFFAADFGDNPARAREQHRFRLYADRKGDEKNVPTGPPHNCARFRRHAGLGR